MGLLQAAYRTYETQAHRAGVPEEGKREPLTPVSHIMQNAQIEITISDDGVFQSACAVPKEENRTIIPATIASGSRTSNSEAHPLCDQICYLSPADPEKYTGYLAQISRWADSEDTHPKVRAVRQYVQGGTIVDDLVRSGVIAQDANGVPSGRIEGTEFSKCLVRWRVIPAPEGISAACWRDQTLFQSFIAFYQKQCAQCEQDICFVSGAREMVCESHPKGVVPANFGAKLISANDSSGVTYRGRFADARQAESVGYTASQMAHNALRWVASNDGVVLGGRTFLCWNPEGKPVPTFELFGLSGDKPADFISYRKELLETLSGYRNQLGIQDDVVIAALDAATTGRLSVTYYNELKGSDFLDRIEHWYSTCCWLTYRNGIQSPSLKRIVTCAFGTERGTFIEADERVLREHVQQLLHCLVDGTAVPQNIVRALTVRASTPLAYSPGNREILLTTTCALVRKYRNDRKKEEWSLSLDTSNTDRSYLFGRLLAVAELAERSTYDREEGREPNAIRMQAVFSQRPLYAWRIINERLNPYFAKMMPGLRAYYKNLIAEITNLLPAQDDPDLGKRLEDTYLLGYYHQRYALTHKKETSKTEGNEDEQSAE